MVTCPVLSAKSRDGRYLRFGVREFAVSNGIAAIGLNLIPFTATFLNILGYDMGNEHRPTHQPRWTRCPPAAHCPVY